MHLLNAINLMNLHVLYHNVAMATPCNLLLWQRHRLCTCTFPNGLGFVRPSLVLRLVFKNPYVLSLSLSPSLGFTCLSVIF